MFGSCRSVKFGVAVLMVAATLAAASAPSYAATGSVRIIITRAAFVVGSGSGACQFQGRRYPLRVGGVSVGPLALRTWIYSDGL